MAVVNEVRQAPKIASLGKASLPAQIGKAAVLLLACVVVLLPFLMVVSTSIADKTQINKAGGYVLWPTYPTLAAYRAVLSGGVVTRGLIVSVLVTVVGTLISVATTAALAYALSRPGSFGHKTLLMGVLLTLLFSPGIIPVYLMVKELHLINSYWSLILPVAISSFNVIVVRAFFMGLPRDVIDSAKIDGASEFQVLTRIILPLSRAALAVIGLFYAVGYWNSFFNALIYLNDQSKWPLTLILRTYVVNNTPLGQADLGAGSEAVPPSQSLQMAILVISLVPIVLVYPFLQRHFTKGVMIGAVKG